MQADDARNAAEPVIGEHVERPARDSLLRRLEDETNGPRKLVTVVSEVQGGAEHDRRVDVVAAGMRDAVDLAAVRHVLLVGHRQCVEVRTQREDSVSTRRRRRHGMGGDVAHETGADGQAASVEPGEFEALVDEVGRRLLLATEFWVRMKIATQRDEALAVFVEPPIDGAILGISGCRSEFSHCAGRTSVIESAASSAARYWTTSASVPPASTTRRWR